MKSLNETLLGKEGEVSFEERVINIVLLLAILMTLVGMIVDILYDAAIYFYIICLCCWILAYVFKAKYEWVIPLAYCLLVFIVVPYNWMNSSGIHGAMPYYSIVFVSIISITTRGWQRRGLVIALMVIQLGLIYYDSLMTDTLPGLMFIGVALHLTILTGTMGVLLFTYSNTYLNEKKRNQAYAQAIETQNREQLHCMLNLEELNTKLKSERHDFNNHIGVIYGLMENEDYGKSIDYTAELVKKTEEYHNIINIPYTMIRAMLNYKLSTAINNNIDLKIDVDLPSGLKLDEYDIGIMLGNLIDNAMTSLEKVEVNDRYLVISINYKPDYLVIRIENPYIGALVYKNNQYLSTKSDIENHGYGLNYIKQIVKKHNGMIEINHENHIFTVNLAVLILP